jgi:hypothetical protein
VDPRALLPSSCIIECKYWRKRVPQSVVHSVRTVAADNGASHAFIVSSAGFQKGAVEAARFTNVKLFSYAEFESYFEPIWVDNYLRPKLYSVVDPLIEYTEPINSRIFRKAGMLTNTKRRKFNLLRKQHMPLAMMAAFLSLRCVTVLAENSPLAAGSKGALKLPWAPQGSEVYAEGFPQELRTTRSARSFLELYCKATKKALKDFDEIFGERA